MTVYRASIELTRVDDGKTSRSHPISLDTAKDELWRVKDRLRGMGVAVLRTIIKEEGLANELDERPMDIACQKSQTTGHGGLKEPVGRESGGSAVP